MATGGLDAGRGLRGRVEVREQPRLPAGVEEDDVRVLSDVVGLSYQEVADALDVPVGTVRSRIHRGRSRLREVLA